MKKEVNFYKCDECKNIIEIIEENSFNITCCGKAMKKLEANTIDAAVEKHIPVYEKVEDELVVRVGEIEHPMEKDHYIMWIAQVTENKVIKVKLYPEQSTETRFPYIPGATLYSYFNKHGLWKSIIK